MKTLFSPPPIKMRLPALLSLTLGLAAPLVAQTTFLQSFNNNNGSFTDSQSALYNWNTTTASGISTVANNISAGNTSPDVILAGEAPVGRGFLFVVPSVGTDAPNATLMWTNHLVTATELQNNPQPDWYQEGPQSLASLTVSDIQSLGVRTSGGSASGITTYVGLQVNGGDWLFASPGFAISGAMTEFSLTNLTSLNWYTGVFDGQAVGTNIQGASTVTLNGSETVTGYAYYGDTGSIAGNASRVRLDRVIVTTIPEPSTYALLGLSAGAVFLLRRRRR